MATIANPLCAPAAPLTRIPVGRDADHALAHLAAALADPVRVRIVRHLAARPSCPLGSLMAGLYLSESVLSRHLEVLREAGLILGEGEGPLACYCIDSTALERISLMVGALEGGAP